MRFKVDENLPVEAADVFRAAGHDASTVTAEGMGGASDADIARLLHRENRAIVTLDVGFADIRLYPPREYPGIVVLRLPRQDKTCVVRTCERLIGPLATEALAGRLWIVEADRIRVHGSGV